MIKGAFIVGGIVVGAIVTALILKKCIGGKRSRTSVFDEKFVTTELSNYEISDWFKRKNPNKKYVNVVMLASMEVLDNVRLFGESRRLFEKILEENPNVILQAVVDKNTDDVLITRAVIFDSMSIKMKELFDRANGVLIID